MFRHLAALSALGLASLSSGATVLIDFEDGTLADPIATRYVDQGVTFNDGPIIFGAGGGGIEYPAHSGGGVAIDPTGDKIVGTLDAAGTDFSVWFTTLHYFRVSLFNDGEQVAFSTFYDGNLYSSTEMAIADVEFDRFEITGTGGYVIDDLSFETQAVPEPASMAALGLGGLALLRRRRKA